ncbi:MAG: MBL fold metallo-hydrolase, partial [Selenomonas sp.]|nr:MBL fold metallo-hydrolase [Selenomonas sp.]
MSVSTEIRIHIFHTGRVCVSPALPFKDKEKNPHPVQLTLLSSYGRRKRVWLPVSAYLIEHPQGRILVDTGWHREISPNGEYSRMAQIRHLGLAHFLLNQGVLPMGESLVEQLAQRHICSEDIDYVLLTHLHSDHASGLRQLKGARHILVSEEEWQDTKKHSERY